MDQSAKHLLLIEDDLFIKELYKRQFDLAGLPTDGANNGKEGLELVKQNHYDAILLDIMMPDMTGIDVLKALRNDEATKTVPVIFMTNLGQDSVMKEGLTLGALGYLIKSEYTPDQLVAEVKKILSDYDAKNKQPAG